jgi:glycosyltransferase involved in cell wall biosynthesis
MEDISVVVPVGPNKVYLDWLPECLASVVLQNYQGNIDIILIDDQANIGIEQFKSIIKEVSQLTHIVQEDTPEEEANFFSPEYDRYIRMWQTPWNCGVADAFNAGIGIADTELVFMLGSDDKLMPNCLDECVKTWEAHNQKDGWYNVPIQLQSGAIVTVNNNAAMISRNLWKILGGFPPSAGVAACDALLLSIMMVHMPDRIIQVESKEPLYWAREHEHQDTRHNMGYYAASGVVEVIRNMETLRWKPREGTLK